MERALESNRKVFLSGAASARESSGAVKPKDILDSVVTRKVASTRSAAEIAAMYIEPVVLTPADREKPEYLSKAKTSWG